MKPAELENCLLTPNSRSYITHFTQPDSIVPDPYNPQDWDRYNYARSNPLKYKDPSGHCVVGSDDYDECIAWAKKIEKEYKNVKIVTCIGENSVDGCKGWTANELELLYSTLNNFDFDISSAAISFVRTEIDIWPGETISGSSHNYQVLIGDSAWTSPPSGAWLDAQVFQLFTSANNFKGTIAHELTHIAIDENPWILDKWISATKGTWMGDRNFFIGSGYNSVIWANLDERGRQAELFCMVNASLLYNGWWNNPLFNEFYSIFSGR